MTSAESEPLRNPAAFSSGDAAGRHALAPSGQEHFEEALRRTGGPELQRRNFVREMPDRGLFVLLALGGFAAVLGLKAYDLVPAWAVTLLAAAIMVLYGYLAWRIPARELRRDRLGDNFYYMGFIFTLASMLAALLQFQLKREGVEIEAILGNFGIALSTTVLGIAGRVMFVQMRTELDDLDRKIRENLLETEVKLSGQMGAVMREMETFQVGILQSIREQRERTLEHSQALSVNGRKMTEAFETLVKKVTAIDLPAETLNRKFSTLIDRLEASAASFATAAAADEAREKAVARFGTELQGVVSALGAQLVALRAQGEVLNEVGARAERLAASLARLDAALGAETARINEAAETAAAVRKRMEADLAASRAALLEVQRAMAETARVVAKHLSGDTE